MYMNQIKQTSLKSLLLSGISMQLRLELILKSILKLEIYSPGPGEAGFEESDYEEVVEIGQSGFGLAPITDSTDVMSVDLRSTCLSFKSTTADFQVQVAESKFEDGYTNEFTIYVDQPGAARTISSILVKDFAGSSIFCFSTSYCRNSSSIYCPNFHCQNGLPIWKLESNCPRRLI